MRAAPPPPVLILMASRNGARWLEAQLGSIAAQDHRNWALWVSDDGSRDATVQIVQDFAAARAGQNQVKLVRGPQAGSAGANFLHLLSRPELPLTPQTAVAFADQDDLWYPGKLSRALAVLESVEGPALYGGQSRHVFEDGAPTGGSSRRPYERRLGSTGTDWTGTSKIGGNKTGSGGAEDRRNTDAGSAGSGSCFAPPPLSNILVQNLVSGHSALLNPAAVALARSLPLPQGIVFHDWWLAQLVAGCGGQLCIDRAVVLDYRQHGRNTLGGPLGLTALSERLRLLRQRAYADWIEANLAALAEAPLTAEARVLVEACRALPRSGAQRLAGFRRLGLHRQSRPGTLALQLSALAGLA